MSKSQMPLIIGLGAAGAIGYYLYSAGGNAKAAESKFESDVERASAAKSHLPGSGPDAEKELKGYGVEAGAKPDKAWAEADKQASRIKSNAEAYAKDAKVEATRAADKLEQKVDDGAAKAKSGISGWFGGGGGGK